MASSFNGVDLACYAFGDAHKSLMYYEQVFEVLKVLYGDQSYAGMAGPSATWGLVHWARGEVVETI